MLCCKLCFKFLEKEWDSIMECSIFWSNVC